MNARATRGPQRGAGRRPVGYRPRGSSYKSPPPAKGGGGGKSGCAVVALAGIGSLAAIGYAAAEAVMSL